MAGGAAVLLAVGSAAGLYGLRRVAVSGVDVGAGAGAGAGAGEREC